MAGLWKDGDYRIQPNETEATVKFGNEEQHVSHWLTGDS